MFDLIYDIDGTADTRDANNKEQSGFEKRMRVSSAAHGGTDPREIAATQSDAVDNTQAAAHASFKALLTVGQILDR